MHSRCSPKAINFFIIGNQRATILRRVCSCRVCGTGVGALDGAATQGSGRDDKDKGKVALSEYVVVTAIPS